MKAICITGLPKSNVGDYYHWVYHQTDSWQLVWSAFKVRNRIYPGDIHAVDIHEQAKSWHKDGDIVSTFSPYVLDEFEGKQVLIFVGDGFVRLVDHPRFDKWSAAMLPGEFWTRGAPDCWLEFPRLTSAEIIALLEKV